MLLLPNRRCLLQPVCRFVLKEYGVARLSCHDRQSAVRAGLVVLSSATLSNREHPTDPQEAMRTGQGMVLNMANMHLTQRSHEKDESCVVCRGCRFGKTAKLEDAMAHVNSLVEEGKMTPDGVRQTLLRPLSMFASLCECARPNHPTWALAAAVGRRRYPWRRWQDSQSECFFAPVAARRRP